MLWILSKENQVVPLPLPVYSWTVAGLALAGLLDSLYMSMSHYRVYVDIGYRSFCAISKSINCDTVSQSTYSIFLGVPIPVWGVIGYVFYLLILSLLRAKNDENEHSWSLLLLLSLMYCCISIILALILTLYIYSYCIMCILIYALNFLLLYYTWLIRKRFIGEGLLDGVKRDISILWSHKKRTVSLFSPFLIATVLVVGLFPRYWEVKPPRLSVHVSRGFTEDGHPWIGSENPRLVINEHTDYLCFQCRKMHFYLRELILQYPNKIRLVHYHYPMDHGFNPIVVPDPFHEGAGKLSLLAIYAADKGKFWEMNDALFSIARESKTIDLRKLAKDVGLNFRPLASSVNDPKIRHKLQLDIWKGIKLKIVGTPSYLINNVLYTGNIPPKILKQVLK